MSYLLAPLHLHRDLGFGATGNAFKDAADHLDGSPDFKRREIFGAQLATNYLYRHAVELYLKSAIVIFHRRFQLPFGEFAFDSEPRVRVGDTWIPFRQVHGIDLLWTYVRELFETHRDWLVANTKCAWDIDADTDAWVQVVHQGDPRSTFFRYPSLDRLESDAVKSPMKEVTEDDFVGMARSSADRDKAVFAMLVENQDREFVRAYVHDEDADAAFRAALRSLAEFCYSLHAAMRFELCDGW
jgi:hypothetical protein